MTTHPRTRGFTLVEFYFIAAASICFIAETSQVQTIWIPLTPATMISLSSAILKSLIPLF